MQNGEVSPSHRIVDTGDVRLAVTERGSTARPTVVLLHGYPDTGSVWDEVAEGLAARFHVITYDGRGAGASTAPRGTEHYRLARLVADLEAVIDEVSPNRPVHLVGHDWGSFQGWEAVTRPRLAGRIASPSLRLAVHLWTRWLPGCAVVPCAARAALLTSLASLRGRRTSASSSCRSCLTSPGGPYSAGAGGGYCSGAPGYSLGQAIRPKP